MTTEKERKQKLVVAGFAAVLGIALGVLAVIFYNWYLGPSMDRYPLRLSKNILVDYLEIMKEHPKQFGFGGEFSASLFTKGASCSSDSCGIALWFCIDPGTKEFFLALEEEPRQYSYKNMPEFPTSNTLHRAKAFNYPAAYPIDHATVERYLRDHKDPATQPVPIDSTEVNKCIREFKNGWGKYCKYNFSFIAENDKSDLKDCLSKAGGQGFLRYYFGYEGDDPKHNYDVMPNRIRVLLVATDKDGDNLINGTSNDPILQSSWPPPPYN